VDFDARVERALLTSSFFVFRGFVRYLFMSSIYLRCIALSVHLLMCAVLFLTVLCVCVG
jgi:hypothetical protein